jgi:hypothetical protein
MCPSLATDSPLDLQVKAAVRKPLQSSTTAQPVRCCSFRTMGLLSRSRSLHCAHSSAAARLSCATHAALSRQDFDALMLCCVANSVHRTVTARFAAAVSRDTLRCAALRCSAVQLWTGMGCGCGCAAVAARSPLLSKTVHCSVHRPIRFSCRSG